MPETRSHAPIRSRLPSLCLRLARMASNTARAACCPCSAESSAPTRPNGPATAPLVSSGTCPDTRTRLSNTRTRLAGIVMPGGRIQGLGSTMPISDRRCSTFGMAVVSQWVGERTVADGRKRTFQACLNHGWRTQHRNRGRADRPGRR